MPLVVVYQDEVKKLLGMPGVRDTLRERATRVAAAARSRAPVGSSEKSTRLRDSHRVVHDPTNRGRERFLVVANKPYAAKIAASSGYLGAALSEGKL